jgi:orotate phosphoribosyltransferase
MLERIEAFRTGEFVLSGGRKSNVYVDCRLATLDSITLNEVTSQLCELLLPVEFTHVGGMTLGADPLVAGLLQKWGGRERPIRGFLVRKESKGHGSNQLFEGHLEFGVKVVVLDDVLSSGGSAQKAVDVVKAAGGSVVAVAAIVDREEGARQRFEVQGIPVLSLLTLKELVELLV